MEKKQHSDDSVPILMVEDSLADVYFLRRAFQKSGLKNVIHVVRDGAEAIAYLNGSDKYVDRSKFPFPGIVFLDLHLPIVDGFQVLEWKSQQPSCEKILFVAISNYDDLKGINRAYQLGAHTFLTKPLDAAQVRELVEGFQTYWPVMPSAGGVGRALV